MDAGTGMVPGAGFGMYVHWPFCESKCPYCDFNSHASGRVNQSPWLSAYRSELDWAAQELNQSNAGLPTVTSIFFGGGTPSLMEPETVAGVIAAIRSAFPLTANAEITLEANPSSAEAGRFREYAAAGVNRVSIGVQSLHDDALVSLGRAHGRDAALATIATARDIYSRYSFDLIYARSGQTPSDWTAELTEAVTLIDDHLSAYQLTIEPGTTFARDHVPAADDDTAVAMYQITQDILCDAGLPAYEVSNHAAPNMESRHNLTYWRGGAYLGIGPGAHGRLATKDGWRAVYRIHDPARWLSAVEAKGHGTAKEFSLTTEERRDEAVMMGLRLTNGIAEKDFRAATGLSLMDAFSSGRLARLMDNGFLEMEPGTLKATPKGMLRLDSVIASLLAE
jgi:putative oxygen-independent coproporphyrinogen III oxidase